MKILGIDASTQTAGVAIIENEVLKGEIIVNNDITHSQKLMVIIDQIFKNLDMTLGEIDGIAVTIGPGSFTGVRIGMATALGLSRAEDIPIAGISTLESLAMNNKGFSGIICPMQDARRNQIYTAFFEFEGEELIRLAPDMAISIDEFIDKVDKYDKSILLAGPDAGKFYDNIKNAADKDIQLVAFNLGLPRPSSLAYVSRNREFGKTIKPNYVRKSQAETSYEEIHGKSVFND
ncbi:MAG: tRNA (adenosine(37)-N6)-threonylcarbamoyltransferase complex dimerization subunit type 1 TsaB [Bacillota bacterium]|nr:tRNA (adenosine(37)-N6)-threonylcarbamoyltransferase complex dimerization subunit type 1 TsaB [Bacillota bacterium]